MSDTAQGKGPMLSDDLTGLLNERDALIAVVADWHRRWSAALAARGAAHRENPMAGLKPLDDAARELIGDSQPSPSRSGGFTQPA